MDIMELPSAWRGDYQPASFRGAYFHVESGGKENARRIVTHEFPKKDVPYSEDMGKTATTFSVRGYLIQYPYDANLRDRRDYRKPRDALLAALEIEGPGWLQLPLLPPMLVVCPRYRLTEEERFGGYCVFDMQFVERGTPPFVPITSTQVTLKNASQQLSDRAQAVMDAPAPIDQTQIDTRPVFGLSGG